MRHGSLFSGIGGFDLAASWMGWENVFQVEIDPFCTKVLERHFPETERHRDIKEFDGSRYKGKIDIITGGYPCQPFSSLGNRKASEDPRHLWPDMLRIIKAIRPRYVLGENVVGHVSLGLEQVCADLEEAGYEVWPCIIPAMAVGACHHRDRVWCLAYSPGRRGRAPILPQAQGQCDSGPAPVLGLCADEVSVWQREAPDQSALCGVVHGIPRWVDRYRALGNAVCPPVVYHIFRIIEQHAALAVSPEPVTT